MNEYYFRRMILWAVYLYFSRKSFDGWLRDYERDFFTNSGIRKRDNDATEDTDANP